VIQKSTNPNVRPWQPTPEQEAKFKATDATFAWLCNLPRDLLMQYAGQWIAAKDCTVVAAGKTYGEMLTNLGDTDLETVVIRRVERPRTVIY
jgi:hypothetical protein